MKRITRRWVPRGWRPSSVGEDICANPSKCYRPIDIIENPPDPPKPEPQTRERRIEGCVSDDELKKLRPGYLVSFHFRKSGHEWEIPATLIIHEPIEKECATCAGTGKVKS